jgi:Vitamin B12 dependent methionine synthase, activation domain.
MAIHFVESEFNPDIDDLLPRLGLDADSEEAEDFIVLLEKMRPLAKPKAAFMDVPARADPESGEVEVGGVSFRSRVLAGNLAGKDTVWPHLATCGRELYDFTMAVPDPFERYWCDEIMASALAQARVGMMQRLEKEFHPGKVASMGPGSLTDWPIHQQGPLFRLLDECAAFTGVELTPTMLMIPNKSVSGILFPSEKGWESCMMCPREKCPNRRAKYDAAAVAALDA